LERSDFELYHPVILGETDCTADNPTGLLAGAGFPCEDSARHESEKDTPHSLALGEHKANTLRSRLWSCERAQLR
jgi:hypothetical protein